MTTKLSSTYFCVHLLSFIMYAESSPAAIGQKQTSAKYITQFVSPLQSIKVKSEPLTLHHFQQKDNTQNPMISLLTNPDKPESLIDHQIISRENNDDLQLTSEQSKFQKTSLEPKKSVHFDDIVNSGEDSVTLQTLHSEQHGLESEYLNTSRDLDEVIKIMMTGGSTTNEHSKTHPINGSKQDIYEKRQLRLKFLFKNRFDYL